jgi:hypothetical protein
VTVLDQFREQGVVPVLRNGRLKLLTTKEITPLLIGLAKERKTEIVDALKVEDTEETKRYNAAFEVELAAHLAAGNSYFDAARVAAARASEGDGGHNDAMTERIAVMDAERYEQDRQARYGYDVDSAASSHAEYVRRKENE